MLNCIRRLIQKLPIPVDKKYNIDISLVIILCIVAQHSFPIKIAGILLVVLLNFSTVRHIRLSRIPLFYTVIPTIEVFKFFFLDPNYTNGHLAMFLVGIAYWVASLLLCWVIYDRVSKQGLDRVEGSIKVFSLLNLLFALVQIARICMHEGVLNPYNTGHHHPYGVSSGDMITGLLHGVHITNAFVSLMLILFFVHRKNFWFVLSLLIPFLLCGSNYGTIVLLAALGISVLVGQNRLYALKSSLLIAISIVLFYVLVTPINAKHMWAKVENLMGKKQLVDEQYQKDVDSEAMSYLNKYKQGNSLNKGEEIKMDSSIALSADGWEALQRMQGHARKLKYDFSVQPGKKLSYTQTLNFLKSKPKYLLLGSGIGGFSSNLAFNFSGVVDNSSMARYFPNYETPYFSENHKSIYESMKYSHIIFHSESNKPFSIYNQLLGEYGLLGLFAFLLLYIGFFVRRISKRDFAFPVLIAVLMLANLNYFFESLSLLLFFEVLMFISIKEKKQHVSSP